MNRASIIVLILLVLALVGGGLYWYYEIYPTTHAYYEKMVEELDHPAANQYANFSGEKCGVWFEDNGTVGKDNESVLQCWTDSLTECGPKVVLMYKVDGDFSYISAIRNVGLDQNGECDFQNTYIEKTGGEITDQWINTCERLAEDIQLSCKPNY